MGSRDIHKAADGVNRADERLRDLGPRVGDAVMCPKCEGGGYVMGRALGYRPNHARKELIVQPVTCPACKGEGLDPMMFGGGE